ncbi:hypothetical protein GCM10009557_01690 [Virgisporangium ochraceum]
MPNSVPPLLVGLLDDAAMFPPRGASVGDALDGHREARSSWYASLVGPLLVPADEVGALWSRLRSDPEPLAIGLVGPLTVVAGALVAAGDQVDIRHIEAPVAKRGEDPMPGLTATCRSSSPPACTTRCGTPTRRPASSITGS